MKYRQDVDGLRALAIIPVVLFHAGFDVFAGGFVGVDVFFVISGYLITRIIINDINTSDFSIAKFYERRIKRIFPALFSTLFVTTLLAVYCLIPIDLYNYGRTLISVLFFFSNFFFSKQDGYFDAPSEANPLLNTWSLSVEEQFYLFFPLGYYFLTTYKNGKLVNKALLGIALLSFSAAVSKSHKAAAFFLPQYRIWELLLGCLLAQASIKNFPTLSKIKNEILSVLGFTFILGSVFLFSDNTPFPSWPTLFPTLGTAFIIYSNENFMTKVGTLLSIKPLRFIGLISYSLYLIHWPIIVFYKYYQSEPLNNMEKLFLVFLSLVLSIASWKWIETPFRISKNSRQLVFKHAASTTFIFLLGGFLIYYTHGWPQRLSTDRASYAKMIDKNIYFGIYDRGNCFLDYDQKYTDYSFKKCLNSPNSNPRVLLWGDSFSAHLFYGLNNHSSLKNSVRQYTATSCRPLLGDSSRCNEIYENLESVTTYYKPDIIIISGLWQSRFLELGKEKFYNTLRNSLERTKMFAPKVVLVGQSPLFYAPIPRILFNNEHYRKTKNVFLNTKVNSELNETLKQLALDTNVLYVDLYQESCKESRCLAAVDGTPLSWDFGHLTETGSKYYADQIVSKIN